MADRHVRNPDAALSGAAKAHYPALQSARGLAAIAVLTCHSLLVFETSGGIHELARITEPLAHVAVVFFFVLSGFVLTLSLASKPLTAWVIAEFSIRRFARIFPALWVACTVAVVFLLLAGGIVPPRGGSDWFESFYQAGQFRLVSIVADRKSTRLNSSP